VSEEMRNRTSSSVGSQGNGGGASPAFNRLTISDKTPIRGLTGSTLEEMGSSPGRETLGVGKGLGSVIPCLWPGTPRNEVLGGNDPKGSEGLRSMTNESKPQPTPTGRNMWVRFMFGPSKFSNGISLYRIWGATPHENRKEMRSWREISRGKRTYLELVNGGLKELLELLLKFLGA
jgi:hypothetical protein